MALSGILGEAGITLEALDKACAESVEVRQGVIDKAKEVQEYWKSIAPVNKTDKPHDIGDGRIDEPGNYRDSIRIRYGKSHGFSAEVRSDDPKAHWLEYGTAHNPEHGFAQKVRDYFKE